MGGWILFTWLSRRARARGKQSARALCQKQPRRRTGISILTGSAGGIASPGGLEPATVGLHPIVGRPFWLSLTTSNGAGDRPPVVVFALGGGRGDDSTFTGLAAWPRRWSAEFQFVAHPATAPQRTSRIGVRRSGGGDSLWFPPVGCSVYALPPGLA